MKAYKIVNWTSKQIADTDYCWERSDTKPGVVHLSRGGQYLGIVPRSLLREVRQAVIAGDAPCEMPLRF